MSNPKKLDVNYVRYSRKSKMKKETRSEKENKVKYKIHPIFVVSFFPCNRAFN